MSAEGVPAELLESRQKIDHIDSRLLQLLAERFALTHEVGLLKADQRLDPLDADREAQKLAVLREKAAELGLDPALVTELFSAIMAAVVKNHQRLRDS